MLSTTHTGAQIQQNAEKVRYIFSATKLKLMFIPDKLSKGLDHHPYIQFNITTIDYIQKETHLGLTRTSDGKSRKAAQERIQTGRRTHIH